LRREFASAYSREIDPVKSNIPLARSGCWLENREQGTGKQKTGNRGQKTGETERKTGNVNREQRDFVAPVFMGCEKTRVARSRGKKFCIRARVYPRRKVRKMCAGFSPGGLFSRGQPPRTRTTDHEPQFKYSSGRLIRIRCRVYACIDSQRGAIRNQ
jgi:hypothetical protein